MGDRALIHFHDGKRVGPVVYLHYCRGPGGVRELLDATERRMGDRSGDVDYTTARCIGLAHETRDDWSGVGVFNAPAGSYEESLASIRKEEYSHGDAGVFLVDCRDWSVETFGGYGFDGYEPDEEAAEEA